MALQFEKFKPSKALPASIMDFVLLDRINGINSPEFEKAIKNGDLQNIREGIESIILNAETKTRIKLSDNDRLMVTLVAQDAILQNILGSEKAAV